MLKMINGGDDKIINFVNYHNDLGVKIIKASRLRSARNVDRMDEPEVAKLPTCNKQRVQAKADRDSGGLIA
jgi:hypothetical protein